MYRVIKRIGHWLAKRSPSQLDRLASVLAYLSFDVIRFRRSMILRNLTIAFGDEWTEKERRRVGRASMRHFFLTIFEFLQGVDLDPLQHMTYEGLDIVQEVMSRGQGAFILCGHTGNWEIMGGAGNRIAKVKTSAIVKEVGTGGLNQLIEHLRIKCGWTPIYRKPAGEALRAIRQALKRNEMVAFILDQARPDAPRIPFFGTPAKTQTSLAAFARKYNAPIIPVSIQRLSPGKHHVRAWPAIELPRSNDSENDILAATTIFNRQLESMIRVAPEQYFWIHNRWKK